MKKHPQQHLVKLHVAELQIYWQRTPSQYFSGQKGFFGNISVQHLLVCSITMKVQKENKLLETNDNEFYDKMSQNLRFVNNDEVSDNFN